MTMKKFGGPQAIRMILEKLPADSGGPHAEVIEMIGHLRDTPVDALERHLFTQAEIDAITDLMMEHFDVGSFVADTAINYLVANRATELPK